MGETCGLHTQFGQNIVGVVVFYLENEFWYNVPFGVILLHPLLLQ
jgi:hypothetical protein